ncbi:hypothetical protein NLM33_38085 [Bradyrhizobium sp. CCGUVB1N3]|uniref:hypothetical protein n=1 Tax=Bradyrhizobium sp. CCGUVB1N3 TaxID=2949629 RepID=UPI0020B22CE9|nr:hypothetical protein [Bradyrhizobium sp. CCGUVB1N3]MCP3476045.1 hypothetical protein [Bradyrhizobium sp. CCGUVB1N3]
MAVGSLAGGATTGWSSNFRRAVVNQPRVYAVYDHPADFRELQDVSTDKWHGLAQASISGALRESCIRDAKIMPDDMAHLDIQRQNRKHFR